MVLPSSQDNIVGDGQPLPLDYNPRSLIVSSALSSQAPTCRPDAYLDAIFIPSRGRPEYVSELLDDLPDTQTLIFLLTTDVVTINGGRNRSVKFLQMTEPEFLAALRRMRCSSNELCVSSLAEWDLPAKRNYALWYARRHHLKRILLLDDDIRGIQTTSLVSGVNALQQFDIAGFFVDDFPDTSVIGHVQIASAETVWTFLSGSCLFIRTGDEIGFFPPIYNEDWLFMIPKIAQRRVCSLGNMRQKPYDPFLKPSIAKFQEPGEIITDCLFALLASGHYNYRFNRRIWYDFLAQRREWLKELADRSSNNYHRAVIEAAFVKCAEVTEWDCVRFVCDWEFDRELWISTLQEFD